MARHFARIVLSGGPFDGEEAAFVPPDTAAPVQIVWSGWFPWGFSAYLYEWHGETTTDRGRTDALIYRPPVVMRADGRIDRGRRIDADEIPPLIADDSELWADCLATIASACEVPPEMIWPGV